MTQCTTCQQVRSCMRSVIDLGPFALPGCNTRWRTYDQEYKPRATAGSLLGYLADHPGATASEVSAGLGLPASSVSRALDRLIERGLVRRDGKGTRLVQAKLYVAVGG